MTNKIEISRELAERLTKDYTGRPNWDALEEDRLAATEELRALLAAPYHVVCSKGILCQDRSCAECGGNGSIDIVSAAPAVERQEPVAEWCDPLQLKSVIKGVIARERMRPTSLPDSEVADAVYAAITEHLPVYEDVYDQLSELIEPYVKRPYRLDAPLPASVVESMGFLLKAYTSPPAPVAVVLPEREHVHSKTLPFRNPAIGDGYISGWNACLDKVKEMNE